MEKVVSVFIFAIFLLLSQTCRSENSKFSGKSVVQDAKLYYYLSSWKKMTSRMAEKVFTCVDGCSFSQAKPREAFMFFDEKTPPGKYPIGVVFLQQVWNITLSKANATLYFMHPTVIERYVNYCLKDGKGIAMIYAKEHFGEPSETFKAEVESLLKATFGDFKKVQ